jgi:hypothetical protein
MEMRSNVEAAEVCAFRRSIESMVANPAASEYLIPRVPVVFPSCPDSPEYTDLSAVFPLTKVSRPSRHGQRGVAKAGLETIVTQGFSAERPTASSSIKISSTKVVGGRHHAAPEE